METDKVTISFGTFKEMKKAFDVHNCLLNACKNAENLLAELETGGADNPELEILRAAIKSAEPVKEPWEQAGYQVNHDVYGWYILRPGEEEPEDGSSAGFDGRRHWIDREGAVAAIPPV
jgi:hypothetical protein